MTKVPGHGAIALLLALNLMGQTGPHPSIAVRFHLPRPSFVTLVIEDAHGMRVRNLVSETYFPAGDNVAWWDGLDDWGRDTNSADHGVYRAPGKPVALGVYTVRGLYRQKIDLKYEFSVYNRGQPPWMTGDSSSEWLTTHTPPGAVCFIPAGMVPAHGKHDAGSPAQVLIGSYVAEGGSGLAWVDLDGNKLHGQMWVGGEWTGAQQIARDLGPGGQPGVYAYTASSWQGELRLQALVNDQRRESKASRDIRLGTGEDVPALAPAWRFPGSNLDAIAGLAAYDGLVIVSLPKMDDLLLIDASHSRVLGTFPVPLPGGLYADGKGELFIVSGKRVLKTVLRQDSAGGPVKLEAPQVFIEAGLDHPQQLTMDAEQHLYVSDWGTSNQVKVFSASGEFLHAIGSGGVVASGPYDPTLMHHPKGITIDSRSQLWVAEEDFQPKRVSVWNLEGGLLRAFYGPATYGGGGNLDPRDKTLFYLDGMTFRLNWETGENTLIAIQHRPRWDEPQLVPAPEEPAAKHPFRESGSDYRGAGASESPDFPIYAAGHKYWTNAYDSNPTSGTPVLGLWISKNGVAAPVAAAGSAAAWPVLSSPAFRPRLDQLLNSAAADRAELKSYMFAWSDLNGDGAVQPQEVALVPGAVSTVTISTGLELVTDTAIAYKPVSFTPAGAPIYDLKHGEQLCAGTQLPTSTGGGQVLATWGGWTILTTGARPFASESMSGAEHGVAKWSYPSVWPGLHASHNSSAPSFPGELIGTTRLLGPSFQLRGNSDIELWAVNGNKGSIYLFTTDGLFVATLFKDLRTPGSSWAQRSEAMRGMPASDLTANEENFWPSITETGDGKVYLVTNLPAVIQIAGLETIRRIAPWTISVVQAIH